jgi:hypothetical protein
VAAADSVKRVVEETKTSSLHYAAALLKRMTSPLSSGDPAADDFARLARPMLEVALATLSEGQDKARRERRFKAEATARGLDPLLVEVEAADPQADLAALQISDGWTSFDLADVVKEDLPPVRWIVKPYIARPSVTVFFGKPKTMKSLLLLDLCLHVAGGYPWLASDSSGADGIEVMLGNVVWLDLENGAVTLKRRMKAIATALGMGEARGQLQAFSMPRPWPDLSKADDADALIARLKSMGDVSVLVLDHLGQVFGAIDENSPLAAQVMGNIRYISEASNVAVILVHHSKKGQGKDSGDPADALRGSGAIMAGVDAAFLIERDKVESSHLRLMPVAVRGPDAPNASAQFAYERDANLDLTEARFWRLAWRTAHARAMDAVLKVLRGGPKNHTELRAAAKQIESGISDEKIRQAIATLEGTREIYFIKADKGAKIYRLSDESEDQQD